MSRPALVRALLVLTLALAVFPASAQEGGDSTAQITAVDSSAFPQISAFVQVSDAAGARVPGLTEQDFQLVENGVSVSQLTVAEQDVGVQVVFVLDTADAFGARDINALTRLDHLKNDLLAYAQDGMRAGLDDVTILTAEGPVVAHANDPGLVARAVEGYTSEFVGVADPFTLLNWGLDFASDSTRQPGMRRLLIYLSNGLPQTDISGQLANIAIRTAAVQVRVYSMYVGPAGGEATTGAVNLLRLAQQNAGDRLLFQGAGSLAPFTELLAGEGRQYRLSYRSALAATGQHSLAAQVTLPEGATLNAPDAIFPLRIEPPRVRLGEVPSSLVRVAESATAGAVGAEPTALAVPIVVDFPDGHPRGLLSAELLVDGAVVASATATTSLASLTWPLASYADSADHVVQAHIIDELGLAAETDTVTVNVSVQVPAAAAQPPAPIRLLQQPGVPLLALAVLGLALALTIGGLAWWSIMRRNRTLAAAAEATDAPASRPAAPVSTPPIDATLPVKPTRPAAPAARAQAITRAEASASMPTNGSTPLAPPKPSPIKKTQPLTHPPQPGHAARPLFRWPGRAHPAQGPIYLEVVEPGGGSAPRADIELAGEVITLGRDGAVAEIVFHDRSVSRLHARIVALNGVFLIYDAGSTSGTWINYAPLPPETGHALQPGDLINLGRVQLRFQRRDVPAAENGARMARVAPAAAHGPSPAAPVPDVPSADAPTSHPSSPAPAGGPVETPE
jgi:hypothetical protein